MFVPENELGNIFVEISNNRQQFSSTRQVFTVYPNSEVLSIYPLPVELLWYT